MTKQSHIELNEIELITRRELAGLLKIGISSIDLIPEDELSRVRLGKSVRFTLKSVRSYVQRHETTRKDKPSSANNSKKETNYVAKHIEKDI
jgi:hypothetical protein